MGETTGISWADHTFNPWEGCARVSAECTNCYAETRDGRWHGGIHWGKAAERKPMSAGYWRQPLKWDRDAAKAGVRRRVFCASLADVFEDRRDLDPMRADLWDLIRRTPNLDWLLLTKRPEVVVDLVAPEWVRGLCEKCSRLVTLSTDRNRSLCGCLPDRPNGGFWWFAEMPDNVWVGTTIGHMDSMRRYESLMSIEAAVRFVSVEPMLGPVYFDDLAHDGIDWVICGGESGPNARPIDPQWVRNLRDQCADAGVPFFFKQWGGAKADAGGHLLDGETIQQFPKPRRATTDVYPTRI